MQQRARGIAPGALFVAPVIIKKGIDMPPRIWRICLSLLLLAIMLSNLPARVTASTPFPDVPTATSYAEAVRELSARGIMRGFPDGTFRPDDTLVRSQIAVSLMRAMGWAGAPGRAAFADRGETDPESWAAVEVLAGKGVVRGYGGGVFGPALPLLREQALAIIVRAMVAGGAWGLEPADDRYPDVAADHQGEVATYVRYAGAVPGTTGGVASVASIDATGVATRGWYATALWQAVRAREGQGKQASPTPTSVHPPTATPTSAPTIPPVPTTAPLGGYRRGVNLAGAEFGESKLPGTYGVDYTYPTAAELDYYQSKGLTLIRLPFRWERLQRGLYGPLDGAELGYLDQIVAAAHARGMQVILDPHNYARYQGQLIGSAAVPNAAFADFWRKLAGHYRDESAIWAYGLMNEPHDTGGLWPMAAQAGVDGIRAADAGHLILVPGDQWSGAWSWQQANANLWISDPANNVMYEAHQYFDADSSGTYALSYDTQGAYPTLGVDRVKPFVAWLQARGARGFIGEYGVPDNDTRWLTVLDTFLSYLDATGIGGTYWAGGPWWGSYPLAVDPRDGQDRPQLPILVRHLSR